MLGVVAYAANLCAFRIKAHAVVRLARKDVSEDIEHRLGIEIAMPQEVDITGAAKWFVELRHQQDCTLEDKAIRMRRFRQPIEQPLIGIAGQDHLAVLPAFFADVEQPCAHRGTHILDLFSHSQ